MIFASVISQVTYPGFYAAKGSPFVLEYQLTDDNVLDLSQCASNMYQVMKNGDVQIKGFKAGLMNKKSYEFQKTGISSASRIFCFNFEKSFGYLTQTGNLMIEDGIKQGKLQFKLLFEHVLDFSSSGDLAFVLTTDGLFVKGQCYKYSCGIPDEKFNVFTKIPFTSFTSSITSFSFQDDNIPNLIIYLENGDVYQTGKSKVLPFSQDQLQIRKIGERIKSVNVGWNASIAQTVLYYLKKTDLIMFSGSITPNELVIKTGIQDFAYILNQLIILKDNVEILYEDSLKSSGVDLYCENVPTDALCIKILENTFILTSDCPNNQQPVCLIKYCIDNSASSDCQKGPCGETDYACWAIECTKQNHENTPQCYIQYTTTTIPVPNSRNSVIKNKMIYRDSTQQSNDDNKISPGAAAGIAVASCVVAFTILLIIVIICVKRTQNNKQQKLMPQNSSAETMIPELTTAQSIEVQ
ncbi:Hypothetical_protein [Hexamita inflata]|uniref:Hypothetical_protein n=1 Tax=Hexamita inflata TaxID=28002 RepID=A0ABP1I2R7_9EUKA